MKKIIFIIWILICSCTKDADFPQTYVNENIPITMAEYSNVYHNLWGYEYINGGLGGIIIVQGLDNEFIAYDRACPFETNNECIVSGLSNNDPILSCLECCNSKFVVVDGSVAEGPANQALKRYQTYFDGTILYITN